MWIWTEDGQLISLDHVERFQVRHMDGPEKYEVVAHMASGKGPARVYEDGTEQKCWAFLEDISEHLEVIAP